jgi:SAM-dependent methyltransferase
MRDYLETEYAESKRPKTTYPAKLAKYLFTVFDFEPEQKILEIGSGRAELLQYFRELGLKTYAYDSAPSAKEHAKAAGAEFEMGVFSPDKPFAPFGGTKFDIIFSKSFVEHIENPMAYAEACKKILSPGGKFVTLTPDWESNVKIFFDDLTHIKPFTLVSLEQMLDVAGYSKIVVFKFRQLPSTWNSKTIKYISQITSIFSHHRVKNKWMRWSRELMLASVGIID